MRYFIALLLVLVWLGTSKLVQAAPHSQLELRILPLGCMFETVDDGSNRIVYLTPETCGVILPEEGDKPFPQNGPFPAFYGPSPYRLYDSSLPFAVRLSLTDPSFDTPLRTTDNIQKPRADRNNLLIFILILFLLASTVAFLARGKNLTNLRRRFTRK